MEPQIGQEAALSPKMGARGPPKGKECDQRSDRWAQEAPKTSQKETQAALLKVILIKHVT